MEIAGVIGDHVGRVRAFAFPAREYMEHGTASRCKQNTAIRAIGSSRLSEVLSKAAL